MAARGRLTILTLLEQVGVKLTLDWDNELIATVPDTSTMADSIKLLILQHQEQISTELGNRAALQKWRFIGGPLDGKRYALSGIWGHRRRVFHEARGLWAVYEIEKDGRAFFKGYATSERKARHGQLRVTEAKLRRNREAIAESGGG